MFDTMDDGEIYAMIKLYDLEQKKFKIIDYKKDYKGGFYSYPSIYENTIVWSYSDCNRIFRGSESGHIFLYDLETGKKNQLTHRDDVLWPVVSGDYIAARVKPKGDNDNSYIVLYRISEKKWVTIASPLSPIYCKASHVEMLLPRIYENYLVWEDNDDRNLLIFNMSNNKFYKLHSSDDYSQKYSTYYLLSKALFWQDVNDVPDKGWIPETNYITILK